MQQVQSLHHDLENGSVTAEPMSVAVEERQPFADIPRLGRAAQSAQSRLEMIPMDMDQTLGQGPLFGPLSPFGDCDSSRSPSRPRRKSYDSIREIQSST